MANWTAITEDDLEDAKVVALIEAAQTQGLEDGQPDPVPKLIQSVVDRIRWKIASCKFNRLDSDPTKIPNGLKAMAVDYIVAKLKDRIEDAQTEDEKAQLKRHDADLNRIAQCLDAVEQPDSPLPNSTVQENIGTPSVAKPHHHERRVRG